MHILTKVTFVRLSRPYLLSILLSFGFVGTLTTCSATPEFRMPSDIPSSIKTYKSLRVHGYNRKKNTGIVLAEQELFTVIATGIIDRGWRGPSSSFSKINPYDGGFIMHIDDQLYGHIHYGAGIGPTTKSSASRKTIFRYFRFILQGQYAASLMSRLSYGKPKTINKSPIF